MTEHFLEVVLPNEQPDLDPRRPAELARLAEGLGYHAAWLPDHLIPPGAYGEVFGGVYEPLVTLGHIAARTERIRLGTSVLIVPLRDRKSTRLNSSHLVISYAVFCLKKKIMAASFTA